jgi:hypothetical protein
LTSRYCFFFFSKTKKKHKIKIRLGYDSLSAIRYPFQFENAGSARDKFHHWTAATAAALFINS